MALAPLGVTNSSARGRLRAVCLAEVARRGRVEAVRGAEIARRGRIAAIGGTAGSGGGCIAAIGGAEFARRRPPNAVRGAGCAHHRRVDAVCSAEGARHRRVGAVRGTVGADRGRRIAGGICIRSARKGVGAGRGLGRGRTGDANCLRYGLPRRQAYSKRDGQAGQNRKPQGSAAQRAASEETRLPALLRRSNQRTQRTGLRR